jgi:site-specific recombinase XerD
MMNQRAASLNPGPVMTIDEAIDEYLHALVRSRPWIKKREEAALTAFSAWLLAQPDTRLTLDAITPTVVDRYAAAVGLSAAQRDQLLGTLHRLYTWAIYAQATTSNPFPPLDPA